MLGLVCNSMIKTLWFDPYNKILKKNKEQKIYFAKDLVLG